MEVLHRIADEFEKRKDDLLVFALLLGFGFFINRGVELKGLYMDDLYLWSCYGEQSFREFVFPMGGTRFRFVFYLAAWLELFFLGNHVTWMVPFNIVLNSIIAWSLYRIFVKVSGGRKLVSLALAAAYLLSRMSYYQIGQFYGLMESLGLWAAVGLLYGVYVYVNEKRASAYFWANGLYFLASFILERYMVLLPVLLLGLVFGRWAGIREKRSLEWSAGSPEEEEVRRDAGRSRSRASRSGSPRTGRSGGPGTGRKPGVSSSGASGWLLLAVTVATAVLIQVIRLFTIGTLSPAGTGGTDVADTFKISDAIAHAWEQVAFVFGRNSGPDYLCIEPFAKAPSDIRFLILASNAVLGLAVLIFLIGMIRDRGRVLAHGRNLVLFLAFIALCIGSSSVTIRVEMRWVYVVYAAALLVLAYMTSLMGPAGFLAILYAALIFPAETYYREHWSNLYLWPDQMKYNSLAEETVEKYGDDIFDKQIYIIRDTYEISEFTAETFLKVYDRDGKGKNTELRFIDSDFDLPEITDDMVILGEDPEANGFQDVTEFVKTRRFNLAYGSYDDGWIDEKARIVFENGDHDGLVLRCYYPGKITGDQVCRIRLNGKQMPDLVFTDNNMEYEIPVAPHQTISLEFSCNFYVKDAKERRGEDRLSMIVSMEEK